MTDRNALLVPAGGFSQPRLYRRRRRTLLVVAAFLTFLLATSGAGFVALTWHRNADHHKFISTNGWPAVGQGAYRVGAGPEAVSPSERPAPIASVAKVMTAYVVLHERPLDPDANGPSLTVTADDVVDTAERRSRDESVIDVAEGEQLSERQALVALMLPSANNVAIMLAEWVADSVPAFVKLMNDAADDLDMTQTTYTDPSGYDPATASTAADQLKLAEAVVGDPVLSPIMAMRSADLPVAGTVHNTNTLLGQDGFDGMKTGSTDAAGACLMFHALRYVNGQPVDVLGVVLGQPGLRGQPLIDSALAAAKQLAERLAPDS
ncbi:MAG TPA: hypothetical protein VJ831_13205 [Jatrophihabitantaceae bacterium]|nr:hypothetical protein [Jatrophihabitantaceae bacterium]